MTRGERHSCGGEYHACLPTTIHGTAARLAFAFCKSASSHATCSPLKTGGGPGSRSSTAK